MFKFLLPRTSCLSQNTLPCFPIPLSEVFRPVLVFILPSGLHLTLTLSRLMNKQSVSQEN